MSKYYYHPGDNKCRVKPCVLLGSGARNGHARGVCVSKTKTARIRPHCWPKTDCLLIHGDCLFSRNDTRLVWVKNGKHSKGKPHLSDAAFKKLYQQKPRRYQRG